MRDFLPMGPKEGVDPKDLSQAGWGIIFCHDADPAIKEALSELLNLRQEQAGDYFRVYEGPDALRPGERKLDFLARHGVGPGPADPDKMPYYLLLVGSPEQIPYTFQYELDVQYAVGRIHFETLEEYGNYAQSVVLAEGESVQLERKAAFFSTANDDDRATQLSTKHMMRPLYELLKADYPEWAFSAHMEADATKEQLGQLIGGDQTPSFLFTSSHGVNFPKGSPRQLPHQGALLCQEWPGPNWQGGQIPQDFYFAGDDLAQDQNLLGLICFSFACYSAGTPRYDDFSAMTFQDAQQIAPHPFMAQLPSRMLSNATGGALAFIGHVDRAWGHSFMWPGAGAQTVTIESVLRRLLDGHPVGSAVEYINERYAEVSSALTSLQGNHEFGGTPDSRQVAMGTDDHFSIESKTDGDILTISTYEASDVTNGPRTLRIQTKIRVGGNLDTTISDSMTEDDQHILTFHNRSVDQAIEARLAHLSIMQEENQPE